MGINSFASILFIDCAWEPSNSKGTRETQDWKQELTGPGLDIVKLHTYNFYLRLCGPGHCSRLEKYVVYKQGPVY